MAEDAGNRGTSAEAPAPAPTTRSGKVPWTLPPPRPPKARWLVVGFFVSIGVVAAVVAIGYAAGGSWSSGTELAIAVGTMLLAGTTGILAWASWELVNATRVLAAGGRGAEDPTGGAPPHPGTDVHG